MLDFAGSEAATSGPFARYFHSSDHVKDNSEECISTLMNRLGLAYCQKVTEGTMLFRIAANQVLQSWCNGGYNIGIHQLSAPAGGCFTKKPWTTRAISHS
jgi:hypothetical protein